MTKNRVRIAGVPMRLLLAALVLAIYLIALPIAMKRQASAPVASPDTEPAIIATTLEPAAGKEAESAFAEMTAPMFVPVISATKVDALATDVDNDGKTDPGDTLMYTVVISNTGPDPATGVNFIDTIDPNTTLVPGSVTVSPIATNDSYNTIGNVHIQVPAAQGLLANDLNPGGIGVLTIEGNTNPTNGIVTINADGSFTYTPNAGFRGPSDSFTYTLGNGSGKTDTGTVTIAISGMIWFVDDSSTDPNGGDGRLATPFRGLVGTDTPTVKNFSNTPLDQAGDNIFLFSGNYTGGLTLLNMQTLIGQGAPDSILAITGLTAPSGANLLPATNGTDPVITTTDVIAITLGQGNQLHGFTVGNTGAAGTDISGTSFGTLTVRDVTVNGSGRALNLMTGTFAAGSTFATVESTGGSNDEGVRLNAVGGSVTITTTNIVNPTGAGIDVQSSPAGTSFNFGSTTVNKGSSNGTGVNLASNSGTFAFSSLAATTSAGTGVSATSSGTVNVTTGSISATGGAALVASSSTLGMTFTTVSSTNSGATGISLSSVGGSLGITTTTTTNPTTQGISVASSSANVSFGNTTSNTSAGTGVSLANNSGNTTFADLDIAPDSGQRGLHATNNTGTIAATSGTITTTSNTAVEITGTSSANRTPLNMSLTSVSASGGGLPNGIVLTNVNGPGASVGFIVNGGGSTAVGGDASGGTISGATGGDGAIAGNGVYMENADEVTLRRITINGTNQNHGIRGINSSNVTLQFLTVSGTNGTSTGLDEGSVNFDNLTGAAAITSCLIQGGLEDNLNIVNTGGTLNQLTITGTTFGLNNSASGNNNILIEAMNAGTTLNFTLESSIIRGARADWINAASNSSSAMTAVIRDNTFSNLGANANPGAAAGSNRIVLGTIGTLTYDIDDNTLQGSLGSAIFVRSSGTAGGLTGSANGRVRNNVVGLQATANSGSAEGSGISITGDGGSDHITAVTNNQVFQYNNHGILLTFGDEINPGSSFAATVTGNTVNTPGTVNTDFNGFHLNNGTVLATDDFTTCLDIANNNFTGGGKGTVAPNNSDVRLRHRQNTTVQLPGYGGPARDNGDNIVDEVITYLRPAGSGGVKNNTFGTGVANSAAGGGGYVNSPGGAACSQPSVTSLASEFAMSSAEIEAARGEPVYRDILFAPEANFAPGGAQGVRQIDLQRIAQAALAKWEQLGVSGEDLERLRAIQFEIADLPDDQLAITTPTLVIIDETAADYGWFVDPTPDNDEEFAEDRAKRLKAHKAGYAYELMDLLTVITRSLDYIIEHQWRSRSINHIDLMQQTLPPSTRRLPLGPVQAPRLLPEFVPPVKEISMAKPASSGVAPQNSQAVALTAPPSTSATEPASQSGNTQNHELAAPADLPKTDSSTSALPVKPAIFNPSTDKPIASYGPGVNPRSYAARARRASAFIPAIQAGGTINLNIGTIPAGKTVTIMFQATINSPLPSGTCSVSNQGTVSGSNFANVLTDDPDVAGAANPTVTEIFIPPTITCPANIVTDTDPGVCTATENFTPTTTGCPVPTVVCTPASGFAFPIGTTTVNCTATNSEGSADCSFTVTVTDNQPPTITCPANITQSNDADQCSAIVNFTPTATDNCPDPQVVCAPVSGTAFPVGTTTVTCTVTDGAGLTDDCSFTVTINDTQPPTLTPCPANITTPAAAGQCSATVNYTAPTATDNCPGVGTVTCVPASGLTFPVGTTTVTCSVSDAAGNPASCSFTVTVQDTQPPQITCPAPISVTTPNGCVTVNYMTPIPTDNCPGPTVMCTPVSGTCFPVGTTTVTCTATDASGNTNSCMFTVSVIPCTITCPGNVTQSADKGECSAVVSYPPPTITGDCGVVTCLPASGSSFPVGITTVTCATGAGPSCSFTVTVTDDMPPTAICPANVVTNNTAGQCSAVVNYTASADDNCPGATVACTPASGSTFPVGTTTVSCTATDASGNMSTPCTFTVTVNDTEPPQITCPANVTDNTAPGQCSAVVNFPAPMASDNCMGVGTPVCTPASGSTFPLGTTTVSCTVADAAGNTANCSFTVTVNDNQPPVVMCPAPITVGNTAGQCSAVVNFTVTAMDNCPGVTVVSMPASGSTFPIGTTTVMSTATDAAGNTASCSFTITVNDTEAPQITCPPTQNAPPGVVNYPDPTVTDNCPGATFACIPPSGSTFPAGISTVTCTATDAAGNTANCTFTITTFDVSVESGSGSLMINTVTGDYQFCCAGMIVSGVGRILVQGCIIMIQQGLTETDRRIVGTINRCTGIGQATLQMPPGTVKCTIIDKNINNNNLNCPGSNIAQSQKKKKK